MYAPQAAARKPATDHAAAPRGIAPLTIHRPQTVAASTAATAPAAIFMFIAPLPRQTR